MKNRLFRVLNFVALNILFFALYLNFVHNDRNTVATVQSHQQNSIQGAVLVSNPQEYLQKGPINPSIPEQSKLARK